MSGKLIVWRNKIFDMGPGHLEPDRQFFLTRVLRIIEG